MDIARILSILYSEVYFDKQNKSGLPPEHQRYASFLQKRSWFIVRETQDIANVTCQEKIHSAEPTRDVQPSIDIAVSNMIDMGYEDLLLLVDKDCTVDAGRI